MILFLSESISIPKQVNSWFANQRTRSSNTRPKKKLQRLHLRLKDMSLELERLTQGIVSAENLEVQLCKIIDEYLTWVFIPETNKLIYRQVYK